MPQSVTVFALLLTLLPVSPVLGDLKNELGSTHGVEAGAARVESGVSAFQSRQQIINFQLQYTVGPDQTIVGRVRIVGIEASPVLATLTGRIDKDVVEVEVRADDGRDIGTFYGPKSRRFTAGHFIFRDPAGAVGTTAEVLSVDP